MIIFDKLLANFSNFVVFQLNILLEKAVLDLDLVQWLIAKRRNLTSSSAML